MISFRWVLGILLVVAAGVALVLYKITRQKGLGKLAIDAIEAAHAPTIRAQQAKLDDLTSRLDVNGRDITKAEKIVQERREDLELVYKAAGASNDEVAARLARLRL